MSNESQLDLLQEEIRRLDGVIQAVVLDQGPGPALGVQAFVERDSPKEAVRSAIGEVLERHGRSDAAGRVTVFELAKEESPEPGSARPRIARVVLTTEGDVSKASVTLVHQRTEVEGSGRGPVTPHSLRLAAATTLEAAQALMGGSVNLALEGVFLLEVARRLMVVVLVSLSGKRDEMLLGACLVGDGPVYEAVVRASLDAVNRQLALAGA